MRYFERGEREGEKEMTYRDRVERWRVRERERRREGFRQTER